MLLITLVSFFIFNIDFSYQKKCNFKTGVRLNGNDLGKAFLGLTIDECCKKCVDNDNCQAYSYKFGIQSECKLKYAIGAGFHPDLKSVAGVVQKDLSAVQSTPETGIIEINDGEMSDESFTYSETTIKTTTSTTTKRIIIRPTTSLTQISTTTTDPPSLENCKREANVKYETKATLDLLSIVSIDSDSCCYMCGLINECVGFNYIKEIPKCLLISRNSEGKYRVFDTKYDYYSYPKISKK